MDWNNRPRGNKGVTNLPIIWCYESQPNKLIIVTESCGDHLQYSTISVSRIFTLLSPFSFFILTS